MAQNITRMWTIRSSFLSTIITTAMGNILWIKFRGLKLLAETKICRHIIGVDILTIRTTPSQNLIVIILIFRVYAIAASRIIIYIISGIIWFIWVGYPFFETFKMKRMVALCTWPNSSFDSNFLIANRTINLFSLQSLCKCFSYFIFVCFPYVNFISNIFFCFIFFILSTLFF